MTNVETIPAVLDPVDGKHYVFTVDENGNPVKVEIVPTGETSQEQEVPPTVH